jgi:sugar lactone lactonase YvrE
MTEQHMNGGHSGRLFRRLNSGHHAGVRQVESWRFMRTIIWVLVLMAVALIAYLALWPVPIEAVSWHAPRALGYVGVHAANDGLARVNLIPLADDAGPEHIVLGRDGKLYAAVESGRILRMNAEGTAQEVYADTGGRVLGFDFDAAGNLIAADAMKGLLAISPQGRVTLLADQAGGEPIRYANAVAASKSGKVYFTDASGRFSPAQSGGTFEAAVLDIVEQAATGRVLEYDPATNTTRIVALGLSFPNGIALSEDESDLLVAETGRFRVWKISAAVTDLDIARPSNRATIVLDNLPGYPDNLMRGLDGRIWLGFTGPRSAIADAMADKPFLREVMLRLPRALWPLPKKYGHVIAFTEDGTVIDDLQDPSGNYPQTTGVTEAPDRLYLQNLHLPVIGWVARRRP